MDSANSGFQCYNKDKKYFLPFDQGKELLCTSPSELERLLKACKESKEVQITVCSYTGPSFLCTEPTGKRTEESPEDLENFYCMSEKDFRRVKERCKDST